MNFSAQDAMAGEGHANDNESENIIDKQHSRIQSAKSKQLQEQEL